MIRQNSEPTWTPGAKDLALAFVFLILFACSARPLYIGDKEDIYDSPLLVATMDGDLHKVRKILAKGVQPDSQRGSRGSTALAVAVNYRQYEVLRVLLAAGANPDLLCGHITPLESAI